MEDAARTLETLAEVPHAEEWELYHNNFSLCSKKVRVCMDELGLPYKGHQIDLIETGHYENVSRRYLAINPHGTVPMLIHNGQRIFESHVQIAYAASHAGEAAQSLLLEDTRLRQVSDAWVDRASIVGARPVASADTKARAGNCVVALSVPLFATMVRYIPYREIAKGLLTHPNKERPMIFLTLRSLGPDGLPLLRPAMKALERARRDLGFHLDALGEQLESHGGPWICGEELTLADVSWVVLLDRLVEADWRQHFWGGERRLSVASYWERWQRRASFQDQVAAVRCSITRQGIADLRVAKEDSPRLTRALEGP